MRAHSKAACSRTRLGPAGPKDAYPTRGTLRFAMSATKSITDVLSREVSYSGEGISVRSLEESIHQERSVQDAKVGELKSLRDRNVGGRHVGHGRRVRAAGDVGVGAHRLDALDLAGRRQRRVAERARRGLGETRSTLAGS